MRCGRADSADDQACAGRQAQPAEGRWDDIKRPSASRPPVVNPVLPRQHALRADRPDARSRASAAGRSDDRCGPFAARCAAPAARGRGAVRRSASARPRCRRCCRRRFRSRHFASTAASSIAMPAPCAANGSMACTASPSSAIAPSFHSAALGHREQRPSPPVVDGADHHPRRRRPASRGKRVLDFVGLARRAPARPVPGSRHDGDDVDLASRPKSDRRPDARSAPSRAAPAARYIRAAAWSRRACRARRSGRKIAAAPPETDDCRTADQMPSAPISAVASSGWRALPRRWTTVSPLACAVTSSNWQPSRKLDIGMVVDLGLQRGLQVGAMHHPIGRAGAKGWRPRRAAGGRFRRRRARS